MFRVSIKLKKHDRKFVRSRRKGIQSFFKFSQTFTSVPITQQKHGKYVFFYFF